MKNVKFIQKFSGSRIVCWIKKCADYLKTKYASIISFLHDGKFGSVIALSIVIIIYFSFELRELFAFIPFIWRILASTLIIPLFLCIINFLYKLIFKKSYLTQTELIIDYVLIVRFTPRGGTSFVLGVIIFLLSLDFFGRCIYSRFIKNHHSFIFWIFTPLTFLVISFGIYLQSFLEMLNLWA